jgi:hypothetical protein
MNKKDYARGSFSQLLYNSNSNITITNKQDCPFEHRNLLPSCIIRDIECTYKSILYGKISYCRKSKKECPLRKFGKLSVIWGGKEK